MKTGKMGLFSGLEGYFRGQNSASKESSGWPGPTDITFPVMFGILRIDALRGND